MSSNPWKGLALAAIVGATAPEIAIAQTAHRSAFSDAELQAYARAHAEIEPIQLDEFVSNDPAEHARDEAQINGVLARNGLSRADYDAIASAALADAALSARITQLAEADHAPQHA